jgi:hypothetical protein
MQARKDTKKPANASTKSMQANQIRRKLRIKYEVSFYLHLPNQLEKNENIRIEKVKKEM